jgi:gamma-glutamylcyclotransferase (GGCT)/AIG2-like uncharacterized protein YtfP
MAAVFVYGTLMQGQIRHGLIATAGPLRIVPARTPGRLADLGDYPGLVPARRSGQWVHGEYAEFQEPATQAFTSLLAQLDFVEEYSPAAEADSLYLRRSVPVVFEDGTKRWARAYVYNRPYDPRGIIRSGDWRRRRE